MKIIALLRRRMMMRGAKNSMFLKTAAAALLLFLAAGVNAQTYCIPNVSATNNLYNITSVSVGATTFNSTSIGTYSDYTSSPFNVTPGSGATITIQVSNTYNGGLPVYLWIDENSDGTFEPVNGLYVVGAKALRVNYPVPLSASGPIRLRVRYVEGGACDPVNIGDVEDYAINLIDTRYVKQGGSGNGNGKSWANASGDLQAMINGIIPGNEVWVAAGTYQPAAGQSFAMKENVKIYGGFPATGSPSMGDRNWRQNVTQLQGNNASVVRNNNNGLTSKAVLDGFVLYNGKSGQGGGIFNYNVSPVFRYLIVKDCNASDEGGGMYVNAGTPQITNVEFVANTVGWAGDNGTRRGAGFYNYEGGPVLVNVLIANNAAYGNGGLGGGVSLYSGFASFTNVTIVNNSAASGAGLYSQNASPQIKNTIIYNNGITNIGGTPNYNYSLIQGSSTWNSAIGNNGGGNIDGNPEFVNAAAGNFTLNVFSPAVNAGRSNAFPTTFTSTDLAGNPRIYNSGTIDIGAYELQNVIAPDANGILYVRKNATGNGSSWANALGEVKYALKAANGLNTAAANTVKQIWVSAGSYQPNAGESFSMIENVKIYGGFAATGSPAFADRNWAANLTTLSGNSNRVINNNNNGLTNAAVLDGFTVDRGAITGSNNNGGGISNINSYPTLLNCVFKNNTSNYWAGALFNEGSGSTKVQNCLFYNNTGGAGGAAFDFNGATTTYTNVTFANNISGGNGNAIHTHVNTNITGYNCIFWGNNGGGGSTELYSTGGSSITLNNSLVTNTPANIAGAYTGNNNVSGDARFTNPTNGDYTLKLTSPAINTGNNAYFTNAATAKDLAGNPRIYSAAIDMGAYESRTPYPDANGRLYVRKGSTGTGESWASALGEVSQALIIAKQFNDASPARIKEIWVAAGDYQPATGETFAMLENVKIYGGFPATGNPSMNDRNWAANRTQLLGNGNRVIQNTNNGLTNAAILDGFTIANGNSSGHGAGIHNLNAYPTVQNCILKNNSSGDWGGAIFNEGNGSTLIKNTLVHNNSSGGGGGSFDYNGAATKYINVTFANNASGNGGGIHTHGNSNITGYNCIFWGNTVASGGSQLYSTAGSSITLYNSLTENTPAAISGTFTGNTIISTNPQFTDATNGNYSLKASSPALNAGNNTYFADAATAKDLAGNNRLFNTTIDLGPYENPYAVYPDDNGILYVRKGATGNGSSWNNAVGEAKTAFNAAAIFNGTPGIVKEIWVSAGDYQPDYQQAFAMVYNVKMYGGFPATGNPTMSDRNYKTNLTQLLGNGNLVILNPSELTNAAVLDGFTIANGTNSGMRNTKSCPLVQNCIFKNNSTASYGGAVFSNAVFTGHSAKFINCLFYGNRAYGGGAVGEYTGSNQEYINCTFANNTATYGSAIYVYTGGSMTLSNCIFWGNSVLSGSGMYEVGHAGTLIINNTIIKNTAGNIYPPSFTNTPNSNIISLDPQFKDAANGDFTLKGASPALNAGNNSLFTAVASGSDLAAMPRFFNNGTIDIGAYEYQALPDCAITTTWNGSSWSNGIPTTNEYAAVIAGNYPSTGNITACSLTVNSGAVTVNPGHNFLIRSTVAVNGGSLTFENNANLLQEDNIANTGSIIYKRDSNALQYLDYTLWSSPVSGSQKLKDFSPGTLDIRFYVYNTALNAYSNYTSTSGLFGGNPNAVTFTKAKGYLIRMPAGLPAGSPTGPPSTSVYHGAFTGIPNNGDISIALGTGGNRFNAVGNPYPSGVNIWNFIDHNATQLHDGTLYFWRKTNNAATSSYATITKLAYNANTAEGGDAAGSFTGQPSAWVIKPGQGFFIRAATTATQLSFTNRMRRASNNGLFFRTAQDNVVFTTTDEPDMSRYWMDITNTDGGFSQAVIGYTNLTTNGLDYGWDGILLNDGQIALYSVADGSRLAIQARSAFNTADVVALGYKAAAAGTLTITLGERDGLFLNGQSIYLIDKALNVTHKISESAYTFTSDAGQFDTRFDIVYVQAALGTDDPVAETADILVYKEGGGLHVNSGKAIISEVMIYDIRGRLLVQKQGINELQTIISTLSVQEQMLVVKVKTTEGQYISKKIIY